MPVNVVIPQSLSTANQTIVSTTTAVSSTSTTWFPIDFFSAAEIKVAVTTCSGTLDVYLQRLVGQSYFTDDLYADNFAHFAQWSTGAFTTTGTYTLSFVNGGNSINQTSTIGVAANTIQTVNFGSYWRLGWVLGGASPTSTFTIYGSFRA